VTIINYIENKRKSIVIHFFGVVISTIGGWGGFVFSCCHNYNRESLGLFFFTAINIIGGEIYLHFFSWCNDEKERSNNSLTKDEISTFWSLFACCTINLSLLP